MPRTFPARFSGEMAEAHSIPIAIPKGLSDKLSENRKKSALVIEGIVKQLTLVHEDAKIRSVIDHLNREFIQSPEPDKRKGGSLGLSAVAVGLAELATPYLEEIVPPILTLFFDEDSGVRYFTCEALYNTAKVVRGKLIAFFNAIFDSLCKLSADPDANMQRAAHMLDLLMKDIITESEQFSIEEFIPLLRDRMNVLNPSVRRFLLGWITVLDIAPEIDMLGFLPDYIDGLFNMLSDASHETRQQADFVLSKFLSEIENNSNVDFGRIANILVQKAGSPDELERLTSITWINKFVRLGSDQLVPYYAAILGAIFPLISDQEEKTRELARETNEKLRVIHADPTEGFDIEAILSTAMSQLTSDLEATKIEALDWIGVLLSRHRPRVIPYWNDLFDSLLSILFDSSDEVILLVLEALASMAQDDSRFSQLVVFLVHNLRSNCSLLEKRGVFIVCRLCVLLNAERVYREFSRIVEGEEDLDFASRMVQALNLILLTAPELSELRALLKQSLVNAAGIDLFLSLYPCWCHVPVALISLCLLAQAYNHTCSIIQSLGEEDINVKFMVQLDKLIHLIETPTFAHLRLQLLEPEKFGWLVKSLYGLLLLQPLPSDAFKILQTRLKYVPLNNFNIEQLKPSSPGNPDVWKALNFASRLQKFANMQRRHHMHAKSLMQSHISTSSTLSQEIRRAESPRIQSPVPDISGALFRSSPVPDISGTSSAPVPDISHPPSR